MLVKTCALISRDTLASCKVQFGDNCIQNFNFGRYIVRYIVGNLVLKCDFQTYILTIYLPKLEF